VIRLLAIDIDGTLLDSRGRLPDAHRDALVEASAIAVEVALVTGRSYHSTRPVIDVLPIPLTLIVNNGAVVKRKDGETELRHVLSRAAARRVLDETRHFEDSVAIVFDRSDERQIVFERMDWSHPNRRGCYKKNKAFIAETLSPLGDMLTEDPIQLMFNGSVSRCARWCRRCGRCRSRISSRWRSPNTCARLLARRRQRRRPLEGDDARAVVERRGITPADVMAVGDNLNDVEMLDFVGTAYVMGNATDALKSRGYRATGTNDEGALPWPSGTVTM
jgi:hydroxymethylpyrimidine pyrophosphatase-like HAD family hydrolase